MTLPRILRRPGAAQQPKVLCGHNSLDYQMKAKHKQLSNVNNNKMLPLTVKDSSDKTDETQLPIQSTSAAIQQYQQKTTLSRINQLSLQLLEPRLVNNEYFVLDGPLVNQIEATEQQSLHTISVTLSFIENFSLLATQFSSSAVSNRLIEFHFELVGQAVHIKWQLPSMAMKNEENNVKITAPVPIGERATARIMCGSSVLLRYLKQSMPCLNISLCHNGSKISKTVLPVGDRLAASDDDNTSLRLLNEAEQVINISGIYPLQQTTSPAPAAAHIGVQILISKFSQLPQEEEGEEEDTEQAADSDAETAFCSSPVELFPTEDDGKGLQLFLEESSIEELGAAGEKLKTAIRDAHQSELAFRRERRRIIQIFKRVQLIHETKRIKQEERDKLAAAAAKVIAVQMREKQRLIEKQQLDLDAEIQRQEKLARELRNKQQKRKQQLIKDNRQSTFVPAEDDKEEEEEEKEKTKSKKRRFSVLRDTNNVTAASDKRSSSSPKPTIVKKKNKKKTAIQPNKTRETVTYGDNKKKRKYKKRNQPSHLKEGEESSDSEEECCAAQPCLEPVGKRVKWVQCDDNCQLWFHYRCEGLKSTDVEDNKDYICRKCLLIKQSAVASVIPPSRSSNYTPV